MEVVAGDDATLDAALPTSSAAEDRRRLEHAARPGRIRDVALAIHEEALANPGSADARMRQRLRDARHLHSKERRLVGDAVQDLLRHRKAIDAALGTDTALPRWLGWLVLQGLSPDAARAQQRAPYERLADLPATLRLAERDPDEAVALAASVELGAARALRASLGEDVGPFLAACNRRAPVTLRAQGLSRDKLAARLEAEGVPTRPARWAPGALHVEERRNLRGLRTFREGWFEVQDEGSQLVVEALAPAGKVIDLCAGAGGKTLSIAARGAAVIAADVRRRPLDELRRRARRAGMVVQTVTLPRTGPLPDMLHDADRVLVDAPCSGSGVLRRHPALRLVLHQRLASLPTLQRGILDRAAGIVAPDGRLVYATCSVFREENEDVVESFLRDHPAYHVEPLPPHLKELGEGGFLKLSPHRHGTDGFFAAILRHAAGGPT